MSEKLKLDVIAVDDPREAVAGADIVPCCTNSQQPVIDVPAGHADVVMIGG